MAIQESSRAGVTQVIAFDGSQPITNAFGAQTRQIRLSCNAHCHYHVYETGGTATALFKASSVILGVS